MSNPAPEQDDIRPVYDFSEAVRGKHAGRFSVSPGEPAPGWMQAAIRYDRLAWIGEALRRIQEVEGLLVVYLAVAFRLEPAAAGREVSQLLEDSEGEVSGRVRAALQADEPLSAGDLQRRLGHLIEERRWLVHRSLHEQLEEPTPTAAGEFTARLQNVSSDAAALTQQLRQLVLARFISAGRTRPDFEHEAEAVIRQWLAA